MRIIQPREVIYLEFVPYTGANKEEHYFVIAVDHASKYFFNLGVVFELNEIIILEKVKELVENDEFKMFNIPFELVMSMKMNQEFEEKINAIIKPSKGSLTISEERVAQIVFPVLEELFGKKNKL